MCDLSGTHDGAGESSSHGAAAGAGLLAVGEALHCGPDAVRWGLRVAAGAEPPPETTRIRLPSAFPSICIAPQYLANEFLPGEGFRDIRYLNITGPEQLDALRSGEADLAMFYSGSFLVRLDRGDPIVLLAGVHIGCFHLFGVSRVRKISDLKGKTVAIRAIGDGDHLFLSSMLAYVGVDPRSVNWVVHPPADADALLAAEKIDALMAFPPRGQELIAKKIGHVVVDSVLDRPWSQYLCCIVAANREFLQRNPIATKRALRAILKAADFIVREPEKAARLIVSKGYTDRYDYTLQALKHIPYDRWREYDPEDTLRFYALRLREVGIIKSAPQKLLAQGTDWRFFREMKRELKASDSIPGGPSHAHHGG